MGWRRMNKILIIALILIVGLSLLWGIKDQVIKSAIVASGSNMTGVKIEIGEFSLSLLRQAIRIKDLKMYNPAGFPRGVMLDLPYVYVDSDFFALLRGKIHLPTVSVELKELNLVKNKEGELNVDSLKVAEPKTGQAKPSKPLAMQIDLLNLDIGRIVMKDYSVENGPSVKVHDINLKRSYKNITSAQQLTVLLMTEPMKQAGIRGAQIYGLSALAGVGALPAAAAITLLGKDSAEKNFSVSFDKAYNVSLKILRRIGQVKKEGEASGLIEASVEGADVFVRCTKLAAGETRITVSARKLLLPKPEVAGGVLYQIEEALK